MGVDNLILIFFVFLVIATLYSSVGHAGASGYLAVMVLLSFAPDAIKPTSLILNIIVSFIASVQFLKAKYFDKKIFLSFITTSFPMAFVGGYLSISPKYFKLIAGLFLIISSFFLLFKGFIKPSKSPIKQMPLAFGLILGAVIGLVSGLIGVGGGIFLSPILIMANWTNVKNASGVAALFILCNSISGLFGHVAALKQLDHNIFYWVIAVSIGGLLGSYLGTIKFNNKIIIACLFLVLLSAGLKFVLVDFAK
ncbi:MAG: sulfite exporter TauE/SafE family protein [Bacteroidetes bacterium]|nr:sulfite exporter TauE/SafE family protein [Bacteroidota bacterium]